MLIIELEFIFIEILKLVKFFKLFIVWIYFYESLDMTSKMFLRWLESLISKIWSFFFEVKIKFIRNEIAIDIFTPRRDLLYRVFLSRFSPCFAANSVTDTLCFLCFSTAVTCLSFSPSFHSRDESFHQTKEFRALYTEKQYKFYDVIKLKLFLFLLFLT